MSHSAGNITRRPKVQGPTRAERLERSMAQLHADIDRGYRYFWNKRDKAPPVVAQFYHHRAA
jgi:hypothetical protein